jgi:dTDP-4-dehydrorhamnose reductase
MKIVIIGTGGRLGAALAREYGEKFDVTGFNHTQFDLGKLERIRPKIDNLDFDVLINAAAFTNVDLCETEREQAFRVNAQAPRVLAEICREKNAKLIHFSTDYVFDGEKREPYGEEDEARPISAYGESKREGEKLVIQTDDRHLVVRVSWVFGPDRPSFIDAMIKRAREDEHVDAVADKFSTPTYTFDIARMLPRFFDVNPVVGVGDPGSTTADRRKTGVDDSGYSGILHFANAGECSWQEYAQFAVDCCRSSGIPLKAKAVGAMKLADMKNWRARRPIYSVLSTIKYISITGTTPRGWRDAVADYIRRSYSKK